MTELGAGRGVVQCDSGRAGRPVEGRLQQRWRAAVQRADRGQNSMDYIGLAILACVVILVIALVVPNPMTAAFQRAVCQITGGTICPAVPPEEQGPTPLEQATSGRHVHMGDSYASGEGAGDYDPDSNDGSLFGKDNYCHRSNNSYGKKLDQDLDFKGGSDNTTCSGAKVDDMYNPNPDNKDENPQLDKLGPDVSLVTLSMGGNDVGFADTIQSCIARADIENIGLKPCRETRDQSTRDQIAALKPRLVELYLEISKRTDGNARIMVTGYPKLFNEPTKDYIVDIPGPGPDLLALTAEDQAWANSMVVELNKTIQEAIIEAQRQGANVEYVDIVPLYDGHGVGSSDPYMNGLMLDGPITHWNNYHAQSFHPNAAGQAAEAAKVRQQIENP